MSAAAPADAARPLLEHFRRRIALEGPVGLDDYMATALMHPAHGYYATRDPLGPAGDFTTAPEISQMFGELIGLWLADAWDRSGRPSPAALVELGPGRGTLMADALRAATALPGFLQAVRPVLVEASPALRQVQARTLAAHRPAWADRLEDLPADLAESPLFAVANEFFDALPIRQFQRTAGGWRERRVGWDAEAGRLALMLAPAADPAEALIAPTVRSAAPEGAVAEICPAGLSIAAALGRAVATRGGAVLVVDYGPARSAPGDSFQAVRRHAHADPFEAPGEADLTAHVDFEALGRAAAEAGAAVHGPVGQGDFLDSLGLHQRAAILKRHRPDTAGTVDAAVARLTGRDQMGTLFKALAICDPRLGAMPGFA